MKQSTTAIIDGTGQRYPALTPCLKALRQATRIVTECYEHGGKVLVCGNGGSAADALHIVGELMKGFVLPRKVSEAFRKKLLLVGGGGDYLADNLQGALPAITLVSEISLMTAFANDTAADLMFAQQVYGYGRSGDTLIAISTSGNSKSVLYACETAKALDMSVIALTGCTGGELSSLADTSIIVPEKETYKIQELHLPVYHTLCLALENEFFGE